MADAVPKAITVSSGTEFASKTLGEGFYHRGVKFNETRPSKSNSGLHGVSSVPGHY